LENPNLGPKSCNGKFNQCPR